MQKAFTLVELAIVLVIIGLIIAGVLVGRDMIQAAEIRSQITQIEQMNTALGTFRSKYNCLPGDCANAASFFSGFPNGDGNGVLTDTNDSVTLSVADFSDAAGEILHAFAELEQAGLKSTGVTTTLSADAVPDNFPAGKTSQAGVIPLSLNNVNYWYYGLSPNTDLSGGSSIAQSSFTSTTGTYAATPHQAYQIDTKMDDGAPASGKVQARVITLVLGMYARMTTAVGGGAATCYDASTPPVYNTGPSTADTPLCQALLFRWAL